MAINLFGPTFELLQKVMDLRSRRHTMIAANIANADTPNYKAAHLKFENELQKALPAQEGDKLKVMTTHKDHLPHGADFSTVEGEVIIDTAGVQRPDGNTVDADKEFVEMSKNQLMYNTLAQLIDKKFKGLLTAIKEAK